MEAGGSRTNTYRELKHNFGHYPDNVLITAEATAGSANQFNPL